MKLNKTALIAQPVKKLALEVQESEIYDIVDCIGISQEEFAEAAAQIAYRLAYLDYDTDRLRFHDRRTVSLFALGLTWRAVTATKGSWVSVSDENGTGLSSSEAYIFHDPYDIEEDEVKTLLDMMNEAWYRLQKINSI